jgi:hypothetical protein
MLKVGKVELCVLKKRHFYVSKVIWNINQVRLNESHALN